eukprot:15477896-Alexandrium_andersonii.AAC.1
MGRMEGNPGRGRRQTVKPTHAWKKWAALRRAGRGGGRPAPPKFPRRLQNARASPSPRGERGNSPGRGSAEDDMRVIRPDSPQRAACWA